MPKKTQKIEQETLDEFISRVYGDGVITPANVVMDKPRKILPTILSLDVALNGGIPDGKIVLLSGKPKLGKTTLCLEILSNAIQLGRPAFYLDIERRCSQDLMKTINDLDSSKLKFIQSTPEKLLSAEDWLDILEQTIKKQKNAVIVVDSLAMLSNLSEQSEATGWNKDMNSTTPRLVASFFRRMQQTIDNNNTILIFISQVTTNRDPMSRSKWVEKGGIAIQYSASVWIKVNYVKLWPPNNKTNQIDGHDIIFDIKTSALGKPHIPCVLPLRFGEGIDRTLDLLNIAENVGLLDRRGSWFTIPSFSEEKFQGIDKIASFLKQNKDIKSKLENKIREIIF